MLTVKTTGARTHHEAEFILNDRKGKIVKISFDINIQLEILFDC